MARFEMNTRTNGRMKFFVPDAGGHVFLESSGRIGRSGILKRQLGAGGSFRGNMLTANEKSLALVARSWYRAYRARQRECGQD